MGKDRKTPLDEAVEKINKDDDNRRIILQDLGDKKTKHTQQVQRDYETYIVPIEQGFFIENTPREILNVFEDFKEKAQIRLLTKFVSTLTVNWGSDREEILNSHGNGVLDPKNAFFKLEYKAIKQTLTGLGSDRTELCFGFGFTGTEPTNLKWRIGNKHFGEYSGKTEEFTTLITTLANIVTEKSGYMSNELTTQPHEPVREDRQI